MGVGSGRGVWGCLLMWLVWGAGAEWDSGGVVRQNGWGSSPGGVVLTFNPPALTDLPMDRVRRVTINWTALDAAGLELPSEGSEWSEGSESGENVEGDNSTVVSRIQLSVPANSTLVATITSGSPHVAVPLGHDYGPVSNQTAEITLLLRRGRPTVFAVEALGVGRADFSIRVVAVYDGLYLNDNLTAQQPLALFDYRVIVIRRVRLVDVIFEWVVAAIALLNSFSIGCTTDKTCVMQHLKRPAPLLLAVGCQLLFMPIMSVGVARGLDLGTDVGLGLLYTACVPGGGAGHLLLSMMGGDRGLSIAINCVTTFAVLVTLPLWVLSIGQLFGTSSTSYNWYYFVVWLTLSAAAYSIGVFLRYCSEQCAESFLNWFAKPFLLLYTLIFITIGVYINMYMFGVLTRSLLFAALLLPSGGYVAGTCVAYVSHQESGYVKTIATESCMSNCLLVLVMVRFSLPQPAGDLASCMPMWIIFLSVIPLVVNTLVKRVRREMWARCASRREKQYRQFSIVSSLLNVTNVTTLSTSVSPKLNSPAEETNSASLVDEKVTVL